MFALHPVKCQKRGWICTHTLTCTVTHHTNSKLKHGGMATSKQDFICLFVFAVCGGFFLTEKAILLPTLSKNWFILGLTWAEHSCEQSFVCQVLMLRLKQHWASFVFLLSYFEERPKHYLLISQSFHSLVILHGDKGHINNFFFFFFFLSNFTWERSVFGTALRA